MKIGQNGREKGAKCDRKTETTYDMKIGQNGREIGANHTEERAILWKN